VSTQSNAWRIAARTLRRAGFGVSGDTVDAVARGSLTEYLDAALQADPDSDPGARATPMPQHAYDRHPLPKNASTAQRQARNKQLTVEMTALSNWWIERMTSVHQPLHEKLTLLWHNHFATSAAKVRSAALMGGQNQKLRTLHTRDFHTLAYAMLTDPAMLVWLDGRTNTARSANENLAREFMELFSLGHGGGYTEDDVREGAKALTGWTVGADGSARLQPGRYNSGPKTLFGQTGTFRCRGLLQHRARPTGLPRLRHRAALATVGGNRPVAGRIGPCGGGLRSRPRPGRRDARRTDRPGVRDHHPVHRDPAGRVADRCAALAEGARRY
jgi:uncharacterized protein (DUF1800 family)